MEFSMRNIELLLKRMQERFCDFNQVSEFDEKTTTLFYDSVKTKDAENLTKKAIEDNERIEKEK